MMGLKFWFIDIFYKQTVPNTGLYKTKLRRIVRLSGYMVERLFGCFV